MKDEKVDGLSSAALLNGADECFQAACLAHEHQDPNRSLLTPIYFLVCQSLELALKAFLRGKGKTKEFLVEKIGHDLIEAFKAAEQEGLANYVKIDSSELQALTQANVYYSSKDLQYPLSNFYKSYPPIESFFNLAKKLIDGLDQFCLETCQLHDGQPTAVVDFRRKRKVEISFVIPCHNEQDNLRALVMAIREATDPLKRTYEIIIADDFSSDNSWNVLKEIAAADARVRGLRFAFNCGQSAALWAGMKMARGKYIITLDADLQNDPRDVPQFMAALGKFDCVCGTRIEARKHGDGFVRIASSHIANWVRNRLSGENISDAGCCYRAFKRECIADLKFFKGMHRFLPTLFKIEGFTVTEIPVRHNPRSAGQSHYGVWNRLFASFYDLLAVRWMQRRMFKYKIAEKIN